MIQKLTILLVVALTGQLLALSSHDPHKPTHNVHKKVTSLHKPTTHNVHKNIHHGFKKDVPHDFAHAPEGTFNKNITLLSTAYTV
jgi:hypothetical protein